MSPPEWSLVYEVVDVSALPIPQELRDPSCMIGPWVWVRRRLRRLAPWLIPPQDARDCCWHHQVNWRWAAATAVRLVREAEAASHRGIDIDGYVTGATTNAVAHEGLDYREKLAISILIGDGCGIQLDDAPTGSRLYQDGQHRAAAHIDQGVRETIIQRYELLDPDTGRPVEG